MADGVDRITTYRKLPEGVAPDKTNVGLLGCEQCAYVWEAEDEDMLTAMDGIVIQCPACGSYKGEPLYAVEGGVGGWSRAPLRAVPRGEVEA